MTSYVFDAAGHVVKQVVHLPGRGGGSGEGSVQVPKYVHGVDTDTTGNPIVSGLHSKDLLGSIIYPEESSGSPSQADRTVFHAYNRLGELIAMEDQNDTRHTYSRDDLGRVERDEASISGSDIDDTVDTVDTFTVDNTLATHFLMVRLTAR